MGGVLGLGFARGPASTSHAAMNAVCSTFEAAQVDAPRPLQVKEHARGRVNTQSRLSNLADERP